MRIISEDITNKGITKSNGGVEGESSSSAHCVCCTLNCVPRGIWKSLLKSQEILVQNEEELCLLINLSQELHNQSPSISWTFVLLSQSWREFTQERRICPINGIHLNSFSKIRPIIWKITEQCCPRVYMALGNPDTIARGFWWGCASLGEERDRSVT